MSSTDLQLYTHLFKHVNLFESNFLLFCTELPYIIYSELSLNLLSIEHKHMYVVSRCS